MTAKPGALKVTSTEKYAADAIITAKLLIVFTFGSAGMAAYLTVRPSRLYGVLLALATVT
jgi:hypothetical protein